MCNLSRRLSISVNLRSPIFSYRIVSNFIVYTMTQCLKSVAYLNKNTQTEFWRKFSDEIYTLYEETQDTN